MKRRDFLRITGGFLLGATFGLIANTNAQAGMSPKWVDSWWGEDPLDYQPIPDAENLGNPEIKDLYCPGKLRLRSSIHGEEYEFNFRDSMGNYDSQVLNALNWFLRCRDGSWQNMDIRTIETLNYFSSLLDVPLIQVNSGYRSPSYNAKIAKGNENVARNSLHQFGRAIDFCVPGVSVREVCSYTLYARNAMGYGGVGYYPRSGFVHLDSGRLKQWAK